MPTFSQSAFQDSLGLRIRDTSFRWHRKNHAEQTRVEKGETEFRSLSMKHVCPHTGTLDAITQKVASMNHLNDRAVNLVNIKDRSPDCLGTTYLAQPETLLDEGPVR